MRTTNEPVGVPTPVKLGIFATVDWFAKSRRGQRLITKCIEVLQTSLGAGNHDFQGNRTGENRLISALAFVAPGFTAIDVGANHGAWTLEVLARSPESRVLALEPGSGAREVLTQRLSGYSGALVQPYAIAEASGISVLYGVDRDGAQASLLGELLVKTTFFEPGRQILTERIETKTFLDVATGAIEQGFISTCEQINFVKIDTEGSELGILRQIFQCHHMMNLLAVQFEFHMHALAQGQLITDFASVLPPEFVLYRLTPRTLIPLSEISANQANHFGFSNWVALNEKRAAEIVLKFEQESGKMRRRSDWI